MRLELPDHPFYENGAFSPDAAVLDGLVGAYVEEAAGAPDALEFLLGAAPANVFGEVLTSPLDGIPTAAYLWVLHVSGYFGGVWLRGELVRARPDNAIAGVSVVPDEAAFAAIVKRSEEAVAAAAAPDAEVLAYVEEHLDPLVDNYGYNQGYLLEILERPPDGVSPPSGAVACRGLLGCEYSGAMLGGLGQLTTHADRLRSTRAGLAGELTTALLARQDEAEARGRTVWSTGLSVEGFGADAYARLLDLSITFLQAVQAAALAALEGFTTADVTLARRAALCTAMLTPWTESYRLGLLDGRDDRRLPAFTDD